MLHLPAALSRPRGGAPPTRWDDPKLAPLHADADGAWGPAWAVTERLLAGLAAETSSAGAPLAVVSIRTCSRSTPSRRFVAAPVRRFG